MNNSALFDYAALAEASYADFASLDNYGDDYVEGLLKNATAGGKFSQTQAADFVKNWEVVASRPNSANGYSATLFKSKSTGEFVYAIRGTEPGEADNDLLGADGQIVANGLAINQIVDMYNDWQRLITPPGQVFQAACLTDLEYETYTLRAMLPGTATTLYAQSLLAQGDIVIDGVGYLATVRRIGFDTSTEVMPGSEAYGLGLIAANQHLTVTGHSLGGHLAAAFTRLFPETGAVATTINGAGFATGLVDGLGGNAESNIRTLFAVLGGEPCRAGETRIFHHNIHG